MLGALHEEIQKAANPEKAKILQRFFKTGKGEYGEGDIFLGITVPQSREIIKKYTPLPLEDVEKLLASKIHEERLIALLLLVEKFKKGDEAKKKEIFHFYLSHTKYINNWDLVDSSASNIVGEWILYQRHSEASAEESLSKNKEKNTSEKRSFVNTQDDKLQVLEKLARSENLWERRIAMIATFAFIYADDVVPTFHIAELLTSDRNDLIQKAVGWMLREAGKRVSQEKEEAFLQRHYRKMGRTALRYAIERLPEKVRLTYLKGSI